MITITGLCKSYGAVQVLHSLECTIRDSRITGLVGPNACGKTTLVKSILGLVLPDSGEIRFGERRVDRDFQYRELIGYMPQNADFPSNLSPTEIFSLLASLRQGVPKHRDELVERFELSPYLRKPCGSLSTGTRQKVSAVAAMMFAPPVLILDEPTAGFDPVVSATFKDLLLDTARNGATIVIVSHIIPELEQLIDDLVFVHEGKVFFSGEVLTLEEQTQTKGLEAGIIKLLHNSREGVVHA